MNKVSIIIPHYDSWDLLPELLDTIPDDPMFEVIVVDDHTDDNNLQIPKFQKKYPQIIFTTNHKNKKGAGAARNKGLEIATGNWLLFADADDKFLSDLTSKIEPYFESDYDIIFFTPISFYKNKMSGSLRHQTFERYIKEYLNSNDILKEYTLRFNFSPPWSKLIRRELVKEKDILFDETKVANDVMFSAKTGNHASKITATRERIYAVRQKAGSITSVVSEENFRIRFNVWINMVNYMRENMSSEEFKEMNISVIPQVIQVINNKLGIKNLKYVMQHARRNNIPLFDRRLFDLQFVLQSVKKHRELKKSNERTVIKK